MADEQGQVKTERLDPEAEARRQLALAQIRQYPDPVLRMRAHEVESFEEDLARLAERMKKLLGEANGVGLAANQVGVLRRIFVIQAAEDEEPRAIVNPRLAEQSDELDTDDEGCLSLQGVVVPVERAVSVRLEGVGTDGEPVMLDLEGLSARVAQHELDHLEGILIIDRTTPESRREALGVLRRPALVG